MDKNEIWPPRYNGLLAEISIPAELLLKVDKKMVDRYFIMPFEFNSDTGALKVVYYRPDTILALDLILKKLQSRHAEIKEIEPYTVSFENFRDGVQTQYNQAFNPQQGNSSGESNSMMAADTELTKLVQDILTKAIDMKASDIHITGGKFGSYLQFRVNGELVQPDIQITKDFKSGVRNRIMAFCEGMDAANPLIPQDGSFKFGDKEFRVNILPMGEEYGSKIAIRINDPESNLARLDNMAFDKNDLDVIKRLCQKPYGIILATGPTGEGKTTTLYGCLAERGTEDYVILSFEEPVERRIEGIAQSPINILKENDKNSYGFDTALKAAMRQDPDIINIAEIRDKMTAIAAAQASQTGHLVFSTIHVRSIISVFKRLRDLGISNIGSITSEIAGIFSQRLVALNCPHCRKRVISECNSILRQQDLDMLEEGKYSYESHGCEKCNFTGIAGRKPIVEILEFNNVYRDFFEEKHSLIETEIFLRKRGFKSLWDKGMALVKTGDLSLKQLTGRLEPDEDLSSYFNAEGKNGIN